MLPGSDGDTIRNETTDDLSDTVETEPDVDSAALFFLRVPL